MKAYLVVLFLLVLAPYTAYPQKNAVVSGFVRDAATGEPLIGATIWTSDQKHIALSDVFGHYALHTKQSSTTSINVSFTGYKRQTHTLSISGNTALNFSLVPGIEMDEIVVKASVPTSKRAEMSMLALPIKELKKLPVLGEPDILKVMQLMPGIQGGAEGRSGLYVRGGSPDQNLMLLDGAPVYYVNHYGNFLSLFHPEIIHNLKLYKGAFPARYGGRISSVVDMRMREGNLKEHKGSVGVGLLSADILLEGPVKKDTSSYIFSFRRFYLDAIMRPAIYLSSGGFSFAYKFYDVYGKYTHHFSPKTRLYLSLYSGEDAISARVKPWDDKQFKGRHKNSWGNILTTARLNTLIGQNTLSDFTIGFTAYRVGTADDYSVDTIVFRNGIISQVHDVTVKSDFKKPLTKNYEILYGAGAIFHRFNPAIKHNFYSISDSVIINKRDGDNVQNDVETYAYIENIIGLGAFVNLNLGMRYSNYHTGSTNYNKLEPRLTAALGNEKTGAIKFSYAQTMQALHLLSSQNVGTPSDIWLPVTSYVPPAFSDQWVLGYARNFGNNFALSVEAYKKQLSGLITYKEGVSFFSEESTDWQNKIEKNGTGEAGGIEFLLQKNNGSTTGWLAYTLAKSERHFEQVNGGKPFAFVYDRRHDFTIVVNHTFSPKYNLSATWTYGSGYPITLESGNYSTYDLDWYEPELVQGQTNPFTIHADVVIYTDKNSVRLRDSHRLDLAFQINGKTKRGRDKTWAFNLYNAYNKQNPAYYYYDWIDRNDKSKGKSLWQQSGIPIMPSFTYRVSW